MFSPFGPLKTLLNFSMTTRAMPDFSMCATRCRARIRSMEQTSAIESSKLQHPEKLQATSANTIPNWQVARFAFGDWNLALLWWLDFGVWNFGPCLGLSR